MMKKAALYVRVSTDNQLENYSIEEQTERLKAYCKAKDYSIYKIYTDGGYSGGNTNRPALKSMLQDIENNKIDTVIVYKLDRLSRSQKDTLSLIEDKFLSNNVDFISMSENFDTSSPFGKAMIGILSVFAQLEKDQITERFTMGRIGRSKAGLYHGGRSIPKGYRYIDGHLIIHQAEAEQVREAFEKFVSGMSINAISRKMEEQYQNHKWNNASKILNCLRNSIYIGKVKFANQEYDGEHEAIISKELFEKVQSILHSSERENRKNTAQKTPYRAGYMLSSLVYCGHCGARYSANHGYYRCYSRAKSNKKFIVDPNCHNINWAIPELDDLVTEEIYNISVDNKYKKLFPPVNEQKNNKQELKNEIRKIDNQINKLIELYQLSDIPINTIKEKITILSNEKEELEKSINIQKTTVAEQFEENIRKFLEISRNPNTSVDEKRFLISSIIERILIDENQVNIVWRVK